MKGKMKATLMVAVMVFSMASACFVGMSSEETVADATPGVILGSSSAPYLLYTDDTAGKIAYIEFNESAFSNNADIKFSNGLTVFWMKSENTTTKSTGNVSGVNVSIERTGTGLYEVTLVGTSSAVSDTIEVLITLTVSDYYNTIPLPAQEYIFKAYVKVINNTGNVEVKKDDASVESLTFNFEEDSPYSVQVANGGSVRPGYVFYATGLPTGISITYNDGGFVIGGKIDASVYSPNAAIKSGTANIYAVSESGKVLTKVIGWTIGAVPSVGSIVINVTGNDDPITNGYVFRTVGDPVPTLTVTPSSFNYALTNVKVSIAGGSLIDASAGVKLAIPVNDVYPTTYDGTGAFTVTIYADVGPSATQTQNVKTISVVETITVYIVSSIVDADLDPIVNSN